MTTSTAITTFNFSPELQLRSTLIDGEPWFVAADVCNALDFRDSYNACRGLDADEKSSLEMRGFARGATIVSESGLYALVMRSNKPEAKKFRKWVTSEVLPSIRKTGSYSVQAATSTAAQAPLLDGEDIRQVIKTVSQTAELALQVLQMVREVQALGSPRL